MYDLIGDIHGHADELRQLLELLGYRETNGCYAHPRRRVFFVGDFVDRGPQIREVLQIVRSMIDAGSAQAVMGNHEFNAIAFHTRDPDRPGEFARKHTEKNLHQHEQTLKQLDADELDDYRRWFRTLPIWHDGEGLRVVHACWDAEQIQILDQGLRAHGGVTDEFMLEANKHGTSLFRAIDIVLKGKELRLPDGQTHVDKDGNHRKAIRVRWFERPEGHTYASYALSAETGFPDVPLPEIASHEARPYDVDQPPVFCGHYWLRAERPTRLATNVACLDFSVAKDGMLCAYRWDGERSLDNARFVSVPSADGSVLG